MGVGRRLVRRTLADAAPHFHTVHLRTLNPKAAAFFEAMGFTKVEGSQHATHAFVVKSVD